MSRLATANISEQEKLQSELAEQKFFLHESAHVSKNEEESQLHELREEIRKTGISHQHEIDSLTESFDRA